MNADDKRHGSTAGAIQHWKDGEKNCPACAKAASAARKRRGLDTHRGTPRTVELGDAWQVIQNNGRKQLSDATGITVHRLARYLKSGPETRVHRTTRNRILAADQHRWTPIGIQRRLQALTALGWSMQAVSDATGIHVDGLKRLRRRRNPQFVRESVALPIIDAYRRMCMTLPDPRSKSTQRTLADAQAMRYAPPLAYDDIDNPNERPRRGIDRWGRTRDADVDPVVVTRILAGDWRLPCTAAEKAAVVAAWDGSHYRLAQLTGWKVERYTERSEDVA